MLSVVMLNVDMSSVIIMSVVNLNVHILNVIIMSVVMLNVIIFSVVSPLIFDRDVFPEWGSRKNYLRKLIDVFGIFIKGEVIIKVSIMVITSTIWKKKKS